MKVKIVQVNEENFAKIPRPAHHGFNCQECFFWIGKRDGRSNLFRAKLNWFLKRAEKHGGPLAKIAVVESDKSAVGFIQYGPIAEFDTAKLYYQLPEGEGIVPNTRRLKVPKRGWCVVCIVVPREYRRQGVGAALVKEVVRDLKKRGVESLDVYPLGKTNSPGKSSQGHVSLWKKMGFTEVEKITHTRGEALFSEGEEVIIMRKMLNKG